MYKPKKQTIRVNVKKNWTDTNVVSEQERNFDSVHKIKRAKMKVVSSVILNGKTFNVVEFC